MKHFLLVILLAILIHQGCFHIDVEAGNGFIRTRGVHFFLNGNPYYANGFNAYWLMYVASDPSQRSKVSTAFHQAATHGLTVARTWAFSDGGYRPLQYSPGSYNEQMFKGLDFVIAEARRYGIKLILSLANNYDSFGGKKQYVNWARNQGRYLPSDDDFFRHPVVKGYFKNHIKTVLNRYNSFTGIHYKDDPTIMAWELMNEPRCTSDQSGSTIQSIDRNHLLEAGLEGFYGQSTPQRKNLNPGIEIGTDFISNNRIPGIDFATVHSYPDQWTPHGPLYPKPCTQSLWAQFDTSFGESVHAYSVKTDFVNSVFVGSALLDMYMKVGEIEQGCTVFHEMPTRNVVSWTAIITGLVHAGYSKEGLVYFSEMWRSKVVCDSYTFAIALKACADSGSNEFFFSGQFHHDHVFKMWTVISAAMVFQELTRRDTVSWSTIIAGYSQEGYAEEAFEYLSWMRREGPKPNEFTLASVLSVCGNMAILEQGKQLHAHVLHVGLEETAMVRSSLVNMYSKCGSLKEASKIFDEAENDDIVSWTAMINGYAEHGCSQEAIDFHAGLVDLGFHYFNSMSNEYQICPSKEHYGCMIDLLCRAGRLSEAESMIKSMPFQKDDVVWSTLLRACRVHGDVDCGRRTAEKILELDPNCAATHITLANMYAAKGRWDEAANARKLMKVKGIIKEPGWSWIKVKDRVSAFMSRDQSHPQGEDIYSMLDLLVSKAQKPVLEIDPLLDDANH
ncbi:hypothetical protein GH714_034121 [Hevea brasiliensis]|uniref:Glycoside hydrolase family 5 domain-containing protein n=1 Tax=Hevea brasiliensis TaxID=3981 RepID=A0A6A6LLM5_HEVBR|nr:hypothetical protein GH714_034121 [Hevea brasiliensis]